MVHRACPASASGIMPGPRRLETLLNKFAAQLATTQEEKQSRAFQHFSLSFSPLLVLAVSGAVQLAAIGSHLRLHHQGLRQPQVPRQVLALLECSSAESAGLRGFCLASACGAFRFAGHLISDLRRCRVSEVWSRMTSCTAACLMPWSVTDKSMKPFNSSTRAQKCEASPVGPRPGAFGFF